MDGGEGGREGWTQEGGVLPGGRVTSCCWCLRTTAGIKINPGDEIIQHYMLSIEIATQAGGVIVFFFLILFIKC